MRSGERGWIPLGTHSEVKICSSVELGLWHASAALKRTPYGLTPLNASATPEWGGEQGEQERVQSLGGSRGSISGMYLTSAKWKPAFTMKFVGTVLLPALGPS